uniref:hypothetical protein n=1 Tax=Niallia sp. 03190 TaxID=3458061 RepID=UPI00404455D2
FAPVGSRLSRFFRRSLRVFRLLSASAMFIISFKNNQLLENSLLKKINKNSHHVSEKKGDNKKAVNKTV